ncbi:hypothetical protein NPIL_33121, partial [Nephila pilipes]
WSESLSDFLSSSSGGGRCLPSFIMLAKLRIVAGRDLRPDIEKERKPKED